MTARASWTAPESFREGMDVPVPVNDAVSFPEPGRVRANRPASVYIRADYVSPRWGRTRSLAPFAYEVSPGALPLPLAYVTGNVYLGSGPSMIGGVTIEVIDGPSTGRRTVSLEHGSYMLEFVRILSPLVVRASKAGYEAQTIEHVGVGVDPNYGNPINDRLHFYLSPR